MDSYFFGPTDNLHLITSPGELTIGATNPSCLDPQLEIERLQAELVKYKIALQTTQEIHQNVIRMGIGSALSQTNQTNPCENPTASIRDLLKTDQGLPAPLSCEEYLHVRFWRRQHYDHWLRANRGDTNGLATEKPKRGRPRRSANEEEEKAQHPYLETISGKQVNSTYLYRLSVKARRIWVTLLKYGLAPETYSEMDEVSREYYIQEMCQEFFELRLCSDFWKLDMWSQKNYPSWAVTHLESKKQKKEARKRQKNSMASSDENAGVGPVAVPASTNVPTSTVPTLTATASANTAPPASTNTPPASTNSNTLPTTVASATGVLASTVPSSTETRSNLEEGGFNSSTNFPSTGNSEPPSTPPSSSLSPSLANELQSTSSLEDDPSGASTSEDNAHPPSNSMFDDPCNDNNFIRQTEERATTSASALVALAAAAAAAAQSSGSNGTAENEDNVNESQSQTSLSTARKRKNNADTGERQKKRTNVLAVIGSGKTAKNFCMAEWLKTNTNGTKDDFDKYFSTLTKEQVQPFEEAARDAINVAAREKRKAKKVAN